MASLTRGVVSQNPKLIKHTPLPSPIHQEHKENEKKEDSDVLLSVQKSEELIFAYELQDDFDTHR